MLGKRLFRNSRVGKAMMGLLSVLVPTLSAQPDAGAAQRIEKGREKSVGVALVEDRVSELISTNGQGTIIAQPDAFRAEVGVEVRARMLEQARMELATRVEHVTKAIQSLGRADLTLQTSELRIAPMYSEAEADQPSKIVGYRARSTLSMTLQNVNTGDLGKEAAMLLDTAVDAGANVVQGLSFFLSHPEQAQAHALGLAVADAERNASVMASAAGVQIGQLHDIQGNPERPGPIFFSENLALKSMAPIEPGEITITANVAARYHFVRP